MQMKSVRGAVVTAVAGAAILGAPAVAQAATIPLEPEPVATQQAGPVLALYDPQTGSASLSSNVNARVLCIFQSVSAAGGLDCLNGAN
ncbi:hypothetical protein [Nocardia pseudobrasiliensis]|uniref:Small secreted domain DUF320 n=1 Tax=Nocardia pseudobrasiliensis TaxID=45979 RepID=A0A370IFD5_9NOCA|nr:hypothetical protein [Nocardia pseudobrasiliensis]RDI69399.1 hypothetical protein DFR76_101939 [Nocardia pseudobrasiliensis]